jgi:hypothetical protein
VSRLRARVDRLGAHRPPPDPLPSWWGREPATLTDAELDAAIAWHTDHLPPHLRPPDPATLTDAELDRLIARHALGRARRRR